MSTDQPDAVVPAEEADTSDPTDAPSEAAAPAEVSDASPPIETPAATAVADVSPSDASPTESAPADVGGDVIEPVVTAPAVAPADEPSEAAVAAGDAVDTLDLTPASPVEASPVTDTPATDAAVAETPAVDTPVADTSVVDTSVVDTSVADTSVADAASTESAPAAPPADGAEAPASEDATETPEPEKVFTPRPGPKVIVAKSVSSLPDDLSPEDFEKAISETVLEFSEGDLVEGTVVNLDHDEVLVDIGYKSEGVIPINELSIRKNAAPSEVVSIGERIEALVLDKEDDEGRLILSKKRAQYERAWGRIEEITQAGGTVTGPVIEVVKGGLIVDIGLRGFLPASLVELRRVRDLDPYIGQDIEAKVIELDRNRNNVVLSRRAYLEEEQAEQRQAFLDDLKEGEVRPGVVSSVVNFGAFVDLGGMDGLVHVSELSWQHVNHPSEVVKVGDEVTVRVLEVDRGRERISLSVKQTEKDPWEEFSGGHEVGDVVEGQVTKTVPFGAFVSVGAGVEGLVHVSEIAMHRVESPELELSLGQSVTVKITEMDEGRRRVSLSIKQALPDWKDREDRTPRRRQPEVREFEREEPKEEERTFDVDASLEAILQELKERGIGRR